MRIDVDNKAVRHPDVPGLWFGAWAVKVFDASGRPADRVVAFDSDAHTVTRHRVDADGNPDLERDPTTGQPLEIARETIPATGWTFLLPGDTERRAI